MKSDPKLTKGINVFWIRFFLVAVYATMCIRDHARPAFHKALGVDIEEYDKEVLKITSEISKQIFPIEVDLDNTKWEKGILKLRRAFYILDEGKKRKGLTGFFMKLKGSLFALFAFFQLYIIPVKKNKVPESPCLKPSY